MKQMDMFNLSEARRARDEGIETVALRGANFRNAALALIESLPKGWVGITEDLRLLARERNMEPPHHPNVWGAITNAAGKRGLLAKTGRMKQPTAKKSHARATQEWIRT